MSETEYSSLIRRWDQNEKVLWKSIDRRSQLFYLKTKKQKKNYNVGDVPSLSPNF